MAGEAGTATRDDVDRRIVDGWYAHKGLTSATIKEKIEALQNYTGYDSYHAYGANETPEMHLSALESAFVEEL